MKTLHASAATSRCAASASARCASRATASGARPRTPRRRSAVLRRALELGVNLIDTADSYGPEVSENLIAEALHPYPDGLVIATKGGLRRTGPGEWPRDARPEHLKECCEGSLRRLKLDRIDLYQLHAPDRRCRYEDSVGALKELQDEGKIRHIGVSNVSLEQLEQRARAGGRRDGAEPLQPRGPPLGGRARRLRARPASASSRGSRSPRASWREPGGPLDEVARAHDATPGQVALAWLLGRSRRDAADPGHLVGGAPRGERRGRRARARRGRARPDRRRGVERPRNDDGRDPRAAAVIRLLCSDSRRRRAARQPFPRAQGA